jgi:hypothetical protein
MFRATCSLALVLVLVLSAGILVAADDSPEEIIAQADLAYMTRYAEDDMFEAIRLFESLLSSLETLSLSSQTYVLNRLSQLCYEAALFSEGMPPEDEELYTKGKEYGLRSLQLNEEFAAQEETDGFEQALAYATDVAAMHWTANNWGMICGIHPLVGLVQQSSVLALFARCVELEPDFWGASAQSALGSLLIMVPGPLGGDDAAGLALIEDSIVADSSYLNNHIILAEYWGFTYNTFGTRTGVRDPELIERETAIVLEAEIGDWPFWNRQAKIAAERLLAWLEEEQSD